MKSALFTIQFICFYTFVFSQSSLIVNEDTKVREPQSRFVIIKDPSLVYSASMDFSNTELQEIDELTSTIEAVLYENGEKLNIAKQRKVPCLKADADIATFLEFTKTDKDRKDVIDACNEIELIRFSLLDQSDFEKAKSIDFDMLFQFPKLKYVAFYIAPSLFGQQSENQQKETIEKGLNILLKKQLEAGSFKIFFCIPEIK